MATENGLYSLQLSDGKIEAYHNVVEEKHVCSFKNIARIGSMLYLGTMGQGIISFDTQTKEFARFVDVGCNVISSLSGDGKSLLYVGTDGNGVHFVSTDKRKLFVPCVMKQGRMRLCVLIPFILFWLIRKD